MTKAQTVEVVTLLAGNYENISKKTTTEKKIMINTWYECLKDLDYEFVLLAVKKTIMESPFMPTIYSIRANVLELTNTDNNISSVQAWDEAFKMISNGLYMTQEEFDKHSDIVKKFFGNRNQLKQLAMVDMDTLNTVVKGQFLKQYEILKQREDNQKLTKPLLEIVTEKQKMLNGGEVNV